MILGSVPWSQVGKSKDLLDFRIKRHQQSRCKQGLGEQVKKAYKRLALRWHKPK